MLKKKIVHIAQSPGGVAEYLYMLLKNWNNKEYENFLIVSEDYKNQIDRFKPYVEQIYFVPMVREITIKKDISAILKVGKILKKIKPDIVYLHSSKAGAIGRIALAFNFKTKIIYNAHGWYFNAEISNKKKRFFAFIEKFLALKTNKIINISQNEYESALKYKIASPKKMCVIENGIDFEKFKNSGKYRDSTRNKYNISNNDIVIGVVGRLSEQKDPINMIKAFNLINKENNNTKLMYVGSGELEEKVLDYAKENNIIDNVIITGWVSNVEQFIPAFDIAVLPSKWEGFGLVLIEYMACDKPIVASNIGGISNIIKDGINGFLIKSGDYKELNEKIQNLINNKSIYKKIIENNKVYREKFDIRNVVKKHLSLFEEEKK